MMEPVGVDTTQIGELAAQIMEDVAADYPAGEVKSVTVAVEIDLGTEHIIDARSTETRQVVVEGILRNAARKFEP